MRGTTILTFVWKSVVIVVVLACWFSAFPTAAAQGSSVQGQDAVYNSSGQVTNSPAFIDASQFANSPPTKNFCTVLNWVLNPSNGILPSTGAVIDARGLPGATGTSMTCTISPWGSGSNYLSVPSTILLPATGGATPNPIIIPNSSPWILPANTHLIGEGDGIPSTGFTPGTTIQAGTGFSGSMIQFGSSSCPQVSYVPICTGISVGNLTLDGQGQSINGITNGFSQDLTSVNHVRLYQILGTGLLIQSSGQSSSTNSGPYSNITFATGGYAGISSTVCAQIINATSTHGIHSLSCASGSEDLDAKVAVLLDSSNNSIEDVRIVGFYDGIRVGANGNASSNVLVNIIGDTAPTGPTPINIVHITNSGYTVSDLSVMGANNAGGSTGTVTIQDDLTGTQLKDTSVGIYPLGESADGGYSRYTTSPNATSWAVGANSPSTSSACSRGSLYSCIGGSSSCTSGSISYALWACALNSSGSLQWVPVK